jgi:beta-glucanase (GH16 family)
VKQKIIALVLFGALVQLCMLPVPVWSVDNHALQSPQDTISAPLPRYALVWDEEFSGSVLDTSKWTVYAGPRRGAQNSRDAVAVANGVLTITTFTKDSAHCTGFIDTANKFLAKYGWFEARIRFESSLGEWAAFWLQSPTMGNPVDNVGVAGAEIDIVEHRAVDSAGVDISNMYEMNLHWDGYGAYHKHAGGKGKPLAGASPLQGGWHTYAVLWTEESYTFFLDGVKQWSTQSGASHRSEFIKLTCEVQNGSWAGSIPAGGFGSRTESTTRMEVDWVRVWQRLHRGANQIGARNIGTGAI